MFMGNKKRLLTAPAQVMVMYQARRPLCSASLRKGVSNVEQGDLGNAGVLESMQRYRTRPCMCVPLEAYKAAFDSVREDTLLRGSTLAQSSMILFVALGPSSLT